MSITGFGVSVSIATLRMKQTSSSISRYLGLFSILLTVALLPSASSAESVSTAHAKVELVSEGKGFVAGRPLWVGLRFDLDKQWHIYWLNPGDSGEPPRIHWNLPTGFRAGPIRWPYPMRFGTPPVVDYGYEDEVLLMLPIQAPTNLKPRQTITIAATVKWLVCRDICIPGGAHLELSLPVVMDPPRQASTWRELFEETRKRVPKRAPSNWKVKAVSEKDKFVVTVEMGTSETGAVFFPFEAEQVENAAPQIVTPFRQGVRLTLKKSDQLLKPPSILKGVVVLNSGRAFEIAAPVAPER